MCLSLRADPLPPQDHRTGPRRLHALIEKLLCLTSRECEEVLKRIPEGLTVGVGHIERFNPVVAEVARVVRDPLYVAFHRHNPAAARVSGSSVVENLMIHGIDVAFNAPFPVTPEQGRSNVRVCEEIYRNFAA
ncbi:MAG TPA: hypothetical protein PLD13_10305 [Methanoculleus sp.]|jgi:hypothetical protein|nr:hypothetical protein [Methanoculleus sp.]